MKLDIISLIFLIIILCSIIAGFKKGFFKIVIKLIKGILSLILAIIFAKPIANILMETPVGTFIQGHLNDAFVAQGGIFTLTITEANKAEVFNYGLTELNIPSFMSNLLVNYLDELVVLNGSVNVAEALSNSLTFYILVAVAFIIVYIVVLLLCAILNKILKNIAELPIIKPFNRLAGALLNGVIGVFSVCIILYLITLILPFSSEFSLWFSETIMLDDPEVFTLSKFLYENNLVLILLEFIHSIKI